MSEEVKKQPLNKTLQWYFNPIEQVRMLRYLPLQTNFNVKNLPVNQNPVYPLERDISVAAALYVTKETNPFHLDLNLYFLTAVNKLSGKVFVLYSEDNITPELVTIIKKYDIVYTTQAKTLYKQVGIGDLNKIEFIFESLLWAKEQKAHLLFIIDPDLIAMYNWVDDVKKLAFETDGYTFTSCNPDWKHFRTEMIGFNVRAWSSQTVMYSLQWLIKNECTIMEEVWFHEIAKILSNSNWSKRYRTYVEATKGDYVSNGYVKYTDILGTNSETNENRHADVLWKSFTTEDQYNGYYKQYFRA